MRVHAVRNQNHFIGSIHNLEIQSVMEIFIHRLVEQLDTHAAFGSFPAGKASTGYLPILRILENAFSESIQVFLFPQKDD
jgi:hypothetical protein